ncbi:MAG: class II fructose-bisphosphate aldolase [Clostridiaceae bacterium]|nr:class II fructose-bisphosphate aldolase [Clostridiaceae bacterium]
MLVNLKEVLSYAEKNCCAIGSFNTPNLECIMAVLQNAEIYNIPVIIAHAQVHENVMPLETIGPVMVLCAKRSKVPVCVHLDHGESLDYIEKALELGFTSVMYDGSRLSFEENVENTLMVVNMARKYGAGIEAEIGVMGSSIDSSEGVKGERGIYTDPEDARKFIELTNVDALAASFGTIHGIYAEKPQLDFQRIEYIKELTKTPLVMHGGSGLSRDDYIKAIEKGIRKINYYTYMAREAAFAAKKLLNEREGVLFHDVALAATEAMRKDTEKAMKVFYKITLN